jgi:hypothetical protein
MTDKFLYNNAGTITEKTATVVSTGVSQAGQVTALDSTGHLDNSVMPVGIGADTVSIVASEALSAGQFVNIYNNAGTPNCRKADNTTTGKEANGFVLAAVSSAASATIYLAGQNTQLTGQVAGPVFLGTAGAVVASAPTGSGNVVQRVGIAVSATVVEFRPYSPIVLA